MPQYPKCENYKLDTGHEDLQMRISAKSTVLKPIQIKVMYGIKQDISSYCTSQMSVSL
jgi:hypothetical protein